jgi:hypothetical protein
MSRKQRTPPKPPTTNAEPDLLISVEAVCARAAGIVNAAARVVAGDELTLQDEDLPTLLAIALQQTAGELEGLSDLALKARTAGGGA